MKGHSGAVLEDRGGGVRPWLVTDRDPWAEGVPGWPSGGICQSLPDFGGGRVDEGRAADVENCVGSGDVGGGPGGVGGIGGDRRS